MCLRGIGNTKIIIRQISTVYVRRRKVDEFFLRTTYGTYPEESRSDVHSGGHCCTSGEENR